MIFKLIGWNEDGYSGQYLCADFEQHKFYSLDLYLGEGKPLAINVANDGTNDDDAQTILCDILFERNGVEWPEEIPAEKCSPTHRSWVAMRELRHWLLQLVFSGNWQAEPPKWWNAILHQCTE